MGAAQLEFETKDSVSEDETHSAASVLKRQAAERLAAHRARRGQAATPHLPGLELATKPHADTRAARIAAAVAERYAHSQSYRAFLAAEAERAIQQAEATAEIAARTAQAVVATQQQLLSELADWTPATTPEAAEPTAAEPNISAAQSVAPLTVRLYEELVRTSPADALNAPPRDQWNEEEHLALDEEIAFRQSPGLEEFFEPSVPLPANLIEFPRQLIAARKARPRLAEGPLREGDEATADSSQLRIFEVAPGQISTEAILETETVLPEWSSIRLDACAVTEPTAVRENIANYVPVFIAAPLNMRLMSAIVDGCLILSSFCGFLTVFACTAGRLPSGNIAILEAAAVLAALTLSYLLLFFTFSEATPGMRYARIGLCTFSDENPTRAAMRRRIVAILLAACPMGLGFLWAWLDDEQLGWHDRISRMYQRSY